jgi:hypothetical protein
MDRDMKERNLEMLNSITNFQAPGTKAQAEAEAQS